MTREISVIQPVGAPKAAPAAGTKVREAPTTRVSFPNPPNVGADYEVDQKTGKVIIKIVNEATKEVIREIPSEEVQRMSQALDTVVGHLYDRKG
jgi:flagellar protein FlaG